MAPSEKRGCSSCFLVEKGCFFIMKSDVELVEKGEIYLKREH